MEKKHPILDSPELFQVLACFSKEPRYAVDVARELGKDNSTVTRQLRLLENARLMDKTTRDKAQYFELNEKALFNLWSDSVTEWLVAIKEQTESDGFSSINITKNAIKQFVQTIWSDQAFRDFLRAYLFEFRRAAGRTLRHVFTGELWLILREINEKKANEWYYTNAGRSLQLNTKERAFFKALDKFRGLMSYFSSVFPYQLLSNSILAGWLVQNEPKREEELRQNESRLENVPKNRFTAFLRSLGF